jgi:predicted nucleotidyltransferase
MNFLATLMCSKVRGEILRILFGLGEPELHLREIQRRSKLAVRGIDRDLAKLLKMDLIQSRRDGNRRYYRANQEHPLYPEIRNIVLKTVGLVEVVAQALKKAPEIRCAFVFGSLARNEEKARSDIDLMVFGNMGLRKISGLLFDVGAKIGREVNPHVLTEKEFAKRRMSGDHFITSVLGTPRIFVIGTENDLEAMGRKQLAESA